LLATRIITGFGILAFIVAAAGIYGVMAFLVVTALFATCHPARQATRVNPKVLLRN
jgi:ABC-type lipoprotein release transport system permease subunit